jgi:hypothetical protein
MHLAAQGVTQTPAGQYDRRRVEPECGLSGRLALGLYIINAGIGCHVGAGNFSQRKDLDVCIRHPVTVARRPPSRNTDFFLLDAVRRSILCLRCS